MLLFVFHANISIITTDCRMEVYSMKKVPLINVVDVICHSFRHLDPRLINHGERVAYILMKMLDDTKRYTNQEKQDIFMLGLLHDIGA